MFTLKIFVIAYIACLLAHITIMMIQDAIDKQVTIFDTWRNPNLYYLSFIYDRARQLRASGMTDPEIIRQIRDEYEKKSFRFLQFNVSKDKYINALNFVKEVVIDDSELHLLQDYVICPNFGKQKYTEMLKVFNGDLAIFHARKSLKRILLDDSEENIDKAMKWFPDLFINPVKNPRKPKEKLSNTMIVTSIYYALAIPENGYKQLVKTQVQLELFGNCYHNLHVLFKDMAVIAYANISKYSFKVQHDDSWAEWKKAILERVNKNL